MTRPSEQESIEEAIVGGEDNGSIEGSLRKYADITQSIFDRFCMAKIEKSQAGSDLAALVMGVLSDAGVKDKVENDQTFSDFFSLIGSPAADLGLINNLSWLFSSSFFPIENFCMETAPEGMPAARDVIACQSPYWLID